MLIQTCYTDNCTLYKDCDACIKDSKCNWCDEKYYGICKEKGIPCDDSKPIYAHNPSPELARCKKIFKTFDYNIPSPNVNIIRPWDLIAYPVQSNLKKMLPMNPKYLVGKTMGNNINTIASKMIGYKDFGGNTQVEEKKNKIFSFKQKV